MTYLGAQTAVLESDAFLDLGRLATSLAGKYDKYLCYFLPSNLALYKPT